MLIALENVVIIAVVAVIVALAALYIHKEKKRGRKCIGCPDSGSCSHNCGSCCCGERTE